MSQAQIQIITEMTTSEMVAEYNSLTGKSIKKFSDRKTGERQLASARQMAETKALLQGVASKPKAEAATKPAAPKEKKSKPAPHVNIDSRSTAVAASWTNKAVAASRAVRTNVSVAGTVYRSVREAFEQLKLPLGQHIKFRMELKAEGVKTFEHDGKKYNFKTIVQQELA
jgi:hypothetical protein